MKSRGEHLEKGSSPKDFPTIEKGLKHMHIS